MTDLKRRLQTGVDRCFAGFAAIVIVTAAIAGMVNACSDEPEPIAQGVVGYEVELDTSGAGGITAGRIVDYAPTCPDTVWVHGSGIVVMQRGADGAWHECGGLAFPDSILTTRPGYEVTR